MLRKAGMALCYFMIVALGKSQQVEWSYSGDTSLYFSTLYWPNLRPDGGYLASLQNSPTANTDSSYVLIFSEEGDAELFPTWTLPPWIIFRYGILVDPLQERYHFLAAPYDSSSNPQGTYLVTTDLDLDQISTTLHPNPPNTRADIGDFIGLQNGDVVTVMGLRYSQTGTPTSMIFQRFSSDGLLLNSRMYENGLFLPHQMVETDEGFMVLFIAESGLGPYGGPKVLRFDTDFNYVDGFGLPDISGNGPVPGQDSIPKDKGIVALPDGGCLVSGEYFGFFTTNSYPVLLKYAQDGTLLDTLSGASRIGPQGNFGGASVFLGLKPLADGNFLWVYEEVQNTSVQSVNHFVTVDADLNILRHSILYGADDTTHVTLNGVAPTLDGGFFVTGLHFYGPNYNAWAAKLSGSSISVQEHSRSPLALFPNPGVTCTVVLPSEKAQNAVLTLSDAQGRAIQRTTFFGERATIDGSSLASGIYLYRVTNKEGSLLGSGKWVRE